jgi:hypothetical protein
MTCFTNASSNAARNGKKLCEGVGVGAAIAELSVVAVSMDT